MLLTYIFFSRSTLHAIASRVKYRPSQIVPSIRVNYKFLSTPEKIARLRDFQREKCALKRKISRLQVRIASVVNNIGVVLDEQTSSDLHQIMLEEQSTIDKLPEDSFQSVYWKQQKEAAEKHKNSMRWHPLMIRWCLYLRHLSSKAYDTIRESGCIYLPSQRTLRDYSHCTESGPSFTSEVDIQLQKAAKLDSSPEWHRLTILLLDEMHIKESLVYNKHSGKMVGFVDLGKVNNHLLAFEQSLSGDPKSRVPVLANSMMTMMVKGLFTPLRFAYAQFPCTSVTGDLLFQPFWEAVFRLERMGFKVSVTV